MFIKLGSHGGNQARVNPRAIAHYVRVNNDMGREYTLVSFLGGPYPRMEVDETPEQIDNLVRMSLAYPSHLPSAEDLRSAESASG